MPSARAAISGGMVAEKNSDWRCRGSACDHPAHVVDEAHVEHPVGLVEDEHLEPLEADVALAHQVEQPAGRGDEDVDAARHRLDLRVLADAAEDHRAPERQVAAIGREARRDLRGELAGRGQHQDPAGLGPRPARIARQTLQDRQRERRGLAGAGLGTAQQIAAREQVRNRLQLDRGRGGVVLGAHGALDRLDQTELGKRSHLVWSLSLRLGRWQRRQHRPVQALPARGRGSLSHLLRSGCSGPGSLRANFARSRVWDVAVAA